MSMAASVSRASTPLAGEVNPLKKVIPKRVKLRDFEGCSSLKDYELLEKIGEGTFGVVHKARHRKSKDLVALKRILLHSEKDGFPITALREIKILKMLHHPNVVPLSDMTVERGDKAKKKRGSIFMVTPYMDHDLCGLLDNPAVEFSIPQIKCYLQQLLQGTGYLHSMRILHRDMKAANLLISNKGILQIADFGLARTFHEDPPPGSNEPGREYTNMVVTRWYRPPELLLGERRYTSAIDLWGIGCIFAEMYKGGPILQGQSDIDQLHRVFQLCGTPTESTMPGWTLLPGCEGIRSFKAFPRQLEGQYAEHGADMVDLLAGLLALDPARRLTAAGALEHAYFTNDPLPASPADLPDYEASHEFDKRKHAAQRKSALPPKAPDAAGQMVRDNSTGRTMPTHRESIPTSTGTIGRRDGSPHDPTADPGGRGPFRDRRRHSPRPERVDRVTDRYNGRPAASAGQTQARERPYRGHRGDDDDDNNDGDDYRGDYHHGQGDSDSGRGRDRDRHLDRRPDRDRDGDYGPSAGRSPPPPRNRSRDRWERSRDDRWDRTRDRSRDRSRSRDWDRDWDRGRRYDYGDQRAYKRDHYYGNNNNDNRPRRYDRDDGDYRPDPRARSSSRHRAR